MLSLGEPFEASLRIHAALSTSGRIAPPVLDDLPTSIVPASCNIDLLSTGPNMLVIALSDSRQVVAISTAGMPADAALGEANDQARQT
jgi:hypothetical protein